MRLSGLFSFFIIFLCRYSGENFVRFTGDTTKHASAQLFAWEAYERGVDVHLLAEPTKLELLQKEYEKKKDQFKSKVQGSILEKYGGEEHLEAPPKTLLLAQTEDYVEYSRSGKVIKGQEKEIIKSKYEEDVYINNHTSVWGSYWRGGQWGYKCCHSFVKVECVVFV
jgi:pre-mRNA-processing factor SLU7